MQILVKKPFSDHFTGRDYMPGEVILVVEAHRAAEIIKGGYGVDADAAPEKPAKAKAKSK